MDYQRESNNCDPELRVLTSNSHERVSNFFLLDDQREPNGSTHEPCYASAVVPNTLRRGSWDSRELRSATIISFSNNIQGHGSVVRNSGCLKKSRRDETMAVTKQAQGEKVREPHIQEHIIAERKRREKLTQKFKALSGVVPDLKKMDKGSILEGAIKYMKQLQEKVKNLEDHTNKSTRVISSAIFVDERSQVPVMQVNEDCTHLCDENSQNEPFDDDKHPKIEVKLYDSFVHVRIQCENHMEVLVKLLTEIQNLNLTVTNMSVIPFAECYLDITVIARVGKELSMEAKELVTTLKAVLRQLK